MKTILHRAKIFLRRILRVPYCTYLCIRFPFLYPRNRFSDLHYTNWRLKRKIKELYDKGTLSLNVLIASEDYPEETMAKYSQNNAQSPSGEIVYSIKNNISYFGHNISVELLNNTILVSVNNKVKKYLYARDYIKSGKVTNVYLVSWKRTVNNFFGESVITNRYFIILCGEDIDPHTYKTKDNYFNTVYLRIKINSLANFKCKLLETFEKYVLQYIFVLPTYTELDNMPTGWKKAFGIRMCADIKKELKKHNYLYKYRITQIKEKFGQLRWYDNGSPEGCIYPIIDKYEQLSEKICINCGSPAKYITRGWISPYCENCVPKNVISDEIKC